MSLPPEYDRRVQQWTKQMTKERLSMRTIHFYVETMHAVASILDIEEGVE